jgi:hypothetical protein
MVNGIEDLATRPDLLDRAISLTFPVIEDEQRRNEDELWQCFNEMRPRVLGALLSAVSVALRNLPGVRLASKPRMADFTTWIIAAQPALDWPEGTFLAAYKQNRGESNALALESAIVAPAILALMHSRDSWQGTARELLDELETRHTDEKTRRRKDWPTSPRKLSGDLRRIAPNLRRAELHVTFGKRTRTGTPITLEWVRKTPPSPSQPSPCVPDKDLCSDGRVTVGGGGSPPSPAPSSPNPLPDNNFVGGDDGDYVSPTQSDADEMGVWTS